MKYGLLYYKDTDNIGDDIQTYAGKRFLPHIDYYIDREKLNCFIPHKKEYVSVIMNAWFIHNKIAWPPSPYINPLLHSMHFTSLENVDVGDKYLQNIGGEYLKKYQPIGARDMESQNRLEKNGIQAYFSGCMTLTINKFENIEKKDKVCLVDVSEEIVNKVKQSTNLEVEVLSHKVEPEEISKKDFLKRMEDVEKILKKYQESKIVITSRIHVALPCIALETPVILIHKKIYEKDRLDSFLGFMQNYVDTDFLDLDITEILNNPRPNKDEYLEIRNRLVKRCEEFVAECENNNYNIEDLPDIDDYYNNYVSRIDWYRGLHEETYLKSKKMVFYYEDIIKHLNEIINSNDKIKNEFEERQKMKENEIKELKNIIEQNQKDKEDLQNQKNAILTQLNQVSTELDQVYNSKGWKFLERLRSIKKRNK